MNWMRRAACVQRPSLAWVDEPARVPSIVFDEMRLVCGSCPVLDTCARFVTEHEITGGFWAGSDRSIEEVDALGGAA